MSFRIALTGLNAASTDLDVVANNIANNNTTGFKESRAEFSDIFSKSTFGTATRRSIGGGVQLAAVTQQFEQGNIKTTGNPLDIAIDGEGFFRLNDNGAVVYTRAGTFGVDREGFVVDSVGRRLTGFQANVNGELTRTLSDIRLATSDIQPQATTSIEYGINLNAQSSEPPVAFDITNPDSYNHSTSLTVFDSLGNSHSLTVYFIKNELANSWDTRFSLDGSEPQHITLDPPLNRATSLESSAAAGNAGDTTAGEVTVVSANNSNLRDPVEIRFTDPGTYDLVNLRTGDTILTGQNYTDGDPITVNGWETTVTGTPAAGDVITIADSAPPLAVQVDAETTSTAATVDSVQVLNDTHPNVRDYAQVQFRDDAGTLVYDVVDLDGNVLTTQNYTGDPIEFNGWQVALAGTPAAGDTVTVTDDSIYSSDSGAALQFTDNGLLDAAASKLTDAQGNVVPLTATIDLAGVADELGITNGAETPLVVEMDMSELTQFGGQSSTNSLVQDGFASGRLVGVNVDDDGVMFGRFSNGQSKVLGQVALANFRNVQGLTPIGDTSWAESFGSGVPVIGPPGTASLGLVRSGSLEGSNVEISEQLVNMINAQRNFQANAQVISTADTLTQALLNLR